jgi:hypothetical protein
VIATRAGKTADEGSVFPQPGKPRVSSIQPPTGILFLGGSTINYPYLAAIQRATGKPVFNNTMGFLDYVETWLTANPVKRSALNKRARPNYNYIQVCSKPSRNHSKTLASRQQA